MKSGNEINSGTFLVKILNKQNSTWQGSITWMEEQKTQYFRSALELIKLIDGVLEGEKDLERGNFDE